MSKNATVNCPNCKEVFKVDDSVYTNIVKQVRDQQFLEEVSNRLAIAENEKKSAVTIAEQKLINNYQQKLADKQREIDILTQKSKSELIEELSKKDEAINSLKSLRRCISSSFNFTFFSICSSSLLKSSFKDFSLSSISVSLAFKLFTN